MPILNVHFEYVELAIDLDYSLPYSLQECSNDCMAIVFEPAYMRPPFVVLAPASPRPPVKLS